ncbi:hypothetical protein B296_00050473, partial [Ensete ventricosum]
GASARGSRQRLARKGLPVARPEGVVASRRHRPQCWPPLGRAVACRNAQRHRLRKGSVYSDDAGG